MLCKHPQNNTANYNNNNIHGLTLSTLPEWHASINPTKINTNNAHKITAYM